MERHIVRSVFKKGAEAAWPALLMRIFIAPKRDRASVKAFEIASGFGYVGSYKCKLVGYSVARLELPTAPVRLIAVTRAPWANKRLTIAAPIPREPPVTSACFPERPRSRCVWEGCVTLAPGVVHAPCFALVVAYRTDIGRATRCRCSLASRLRATSKKDLQGGGAQWRRGRRGPPR